MDKKRKSSLAEVGLFGAGLLVAVVGSTLTVYWEAWIIITSGAILFALSFVGRSLWRAIHKSMSKN